MTFSSFQHLSTVIVYLFSEDYDVQLLSIESIRELGYPKMANDAARIQFADPENARAVSLQQKRVEFEFAKLDSLAPEIVGAATSKFLERLGNKKVIAVGTNYVSKVVVDGIDDAGAFIKDRFLKAHDKVSAALKRDVIASSTRFFAGTPQDYLDIRISLSDLGKPAFIYNLHVHKDIADPATYRFQDDILARLKSEKDLLPKVFEQVIS